MSNDNKTLADVQPGGRVRLGDADPMRSALEDALQFVETLHSTVAGDSRKIVWRCLERGRAALSAQPSPGGQGDASHYWPEVDRILVDAYVAGSEGDEFDMIAARNAIRAAIAARQPVSESPMAKMAAALRGKAEAEKAAFDQRVQSGEWGPMPDQYDTRSFCAVCDGSGWKDASENELCPVCEGQGIGTSLAARQPVGLSDTFQHGVSEWMDKCFLPSLYSDMTERGDRLLEEVLELLQAHGYDKARVPTLVDYVFSRPVGDPAQEVGGVMVTLAGYCWVAGLDMHAAGNTELARINQPEVMAKIRAKQEAKNALHVDTPLPGNADTTVEEWPREGDLVRYGTGSSALAIRLGPHAGGWHGYQCCGGYTFFTKAYRPSRADMDTWLDCAKYRDERTKVADSRVAREMYLLDSQVAGNG